MIDNDDPTLAKLTRKQMVYAFCIALVIVSVVVSSTTASKMYDVNLFGLEIFVPIGTSLFCLSFLATDVISEIWGRNHAIFAAFLGMFARAFAAAFYGIAIIIPGIEGWEHQVAYETILGSGSRILLAGVIAYFIASVIDAYVYHYFRERHKDKNLLFLRNNISTFTAQSIGAIIFTTIAFYGLVSLDKLILIALGNMMVKWLMAVIDTPLVYILRNFTLHKPLLSFKG